MDAFGICDKATSARPWWPRPSAAAARREPGSHARSCACLRCRRRSELFRTIELASGGSQSGGEMRLLDLWSGGSCQHRSGSTCRGCRAGAGTWIAHCRRTGSRSSTTAVTTSRTRSGTTTSSATRPSAGSMGHDPSERPPAARRARPGRGYLGQHRGAGTAARSRPAHEELIKLSRNASGYPRSIRIRNVTT